MLWRFDCFRTQFNLLVFFHRFSPLFLIDCLKTFLMHQWSIATVRWICESILKSCLFIFFSNIRPKKLIILKRSFYSFFRVSFFFCLSSIYARQLCHAFILEKTLVVWNVDVDINVIKYSFTSREIPIVLVFSYICSISPMINQF